MESKLNSGFFSSASGNASNVMYLMGQRPDFHHRPIYPTPVDETYLTNNQVSCKNIII